MVVRMFEYDCAIAIEQAIKNGKPYEIRFPDSCVLYLRDDGSRQNSMEMRVIMPNQQVCTYSAKIIRVSDYTSDEIFQKRLLCMLPFYILRYEKELGAIEGSTERTKELLDEYRTIVARLGDELNTEEKSGIYNDLVYMIQEIAEHVLRNRKKLKQEVTGIVGGRILELPSDRIRKQMQAECREAKMEGLQEGRLDVISRMISKNYTKEQILDLGYTEDDYRMAQEQLINS